MSTVPRPGLDRHSLFSTRTARWTVGIGIAMMVIIGVLLLFLLSINQGLT